MMKQFSAEIWMILFMESIQIGGKDRKKGFPYTLCSKCYYGVHNDPRLLKFSTKISLFNQLSYGEISF